MTALMPSVILFTSWWGASKQVASGGDIGHKALCPMSESRLPTGEEFPLAD
eukprot:COSAG02_NODE_63244_length_263_cov_1.530488_1_plen_50_part_01